MKRIIVWIDCKNDDVEQVCKKLEKFLSSVGSWHKVVDISELKVVEESK